MFEYNLIACPGYPEVVDELLALSDGINNEAFVVADTPVNKNPEQTANWGSTSEKFSHTTAAYYYPWGLASNLDGTDVVVAPSGIALRTYAYSDNISYIWEAPAGVRRGVVTGVSKVGYVTGTLGQATTFVEAILNQGQRDNLYEFYKNINPITYFPQRGLIIWGQKTAAGAASDRSRVNVERLICYIRRALRKAGFPFCFEINNARTRGDLKFMLDGFFGDLLTKGGLEDYITICDLSNNTPYVRTNNQIVGDIGIIPPHVAEFVVLPVTVYTAGAKMG
jgi:phage tail sheath protein FI